MAAARQKEMNESMTVAGTTNFVNSPCSIDLIGFNCTAVVDGRYRAGGPGPPNPRTRWHAELRMVSPISPQLLQTGNTSGARTGDAARSSPVFEEPGLPPAALCQAGREEAGGGRGDRS